MTAPRCSPSWRSPWTRLLVASGRRRDGRLLQYIEGWTAINQANRIFGHDGWGTEVVGEVRYRPMSLDRSRHRGAAGGRDVHGRRAGHRSRLPARAMSAAPSSPARRRKPTRPPTRVR